MDLPKQAAGAPELPLAPPPGLREWLSISLRIGCISFGGAAGQIAMMHRMLVDEKRWFSERDFLNGLNFCTLLPGPEAQQLATYLGWRLFGIRGGLISGILFVAPGAAVILVLAQLYVIGAQIPVVAGLLLGIKAAVIAIIVQAVLRLGRRALGGMIYRLAALAAFLALSFSTLPFPLLILGAALVGFSIARFEGSAAAPAPPAAAAPLAPVARTALLTFLAWWLPVGAAALVLGGDHLLVEIGLFFSKLAVITFGGAYAVLAYLAEEGVKRGWADPRQMIDALGLAETTPGPTILVNPFIAFLAGSRGGGSTIMAWLAGLMATWTTFAPSFLWIFVGGPFIEKFARNPALSGMLKGISAAVVGIIAAVAYKFSVVFFFAAPWRFEAGPISALLPGGRPDWTAFGLAIVAAWLLFARRWPLTRMLAAIAGAGAAVTVARALA